MRSSQQVNLALGLTPAIPIASYMSTHSLPSEQVGVGEMKLCIDICDVHIAKQKSNTVASHDVRYMN